MDKKPTLGPDPLGRIKSGIEMECLFLAICLTFVMVSSVNVSGNRKDTRMSRGGSLEGREK